MRTRLVNIGRMIFVIVLIAVVYAFSNKRNSNRKLQAVAVSFEDRSSALITEAMVNKLLIQKADSIAAVDKDIIDLNALEGRLNSHPMIRNADVFLSLDGVLGARVTQRRPIARVASNPSYYIDEEGTKRPLSRVHSLRVPLVSGVSEDNLKPVTHVLNEILADPFMVQHVVAIEQQRDSTLIMRVRTYDFKILLGKPVNIKRKFQNFKAFYQKTIKDKTLGNYQLVNLMMDHQVVATKK